MHEQEAAGDSHSVDHAVDIRFLSLQSPIHHSCVFSGTGSVPGPVHTTLHGLFILPRQNDDLLADCLLYFRVSIVATGLSSPTPRRNQITRVLMRNNVRTHGVRRCSDKSWFEPKNPKPRPLHDEVRLSHKASATWFSRFCAAGKSADLPEAKSTLPESVITRPRSSSFTAASLARAACASAVLFQRRSAPSPQTPSPCLRSPGFSRDLGRLQQRYSQRRGGKRPPLASICDRQVRLERFVGKTSR
jgi:hypothetical protein